MSALLQRSTARLALLSGPSSTNRCDVFMSTSYYDGSFNDVTGYFAFFLLSQTLMKCRSYDSCAEIRCPKAVTSSSWE